MKQGIHPNYVDCTITCACGNVIKTRSTKPEIHVEICSKCHPFYTGKQKLVDTGGRVDRFNRRFGASNCITIRISILPILGSGVFALPGQNLKILKFFQRSPFCPILNTFAPYTYL